MLIKITHEAIVPSELDSVLKDPACGGISTFEGRVRDKHKGRAVKKLEYSCHESLAEKQLKGLAIQAKAQFHVNHVVIVHRVGEIPIGEIAVWVAVAAMHRGEAFGACRWLIDTLKHDVPIWKKETYADGEVAWQEGCDCVPVEKAVQHTHVDHS